VGHSWEGACTPTRFEPSPCTLSLRGAPSTAVGLAATAALTLTLSLNHLPPHPHHHTHGDVSRAPLD
jgi:hypothetical protein